MLTNLTTKHTGTTEEYSEDINILSSQIIECAIQIHRQLGPGLLESAYQHALAYKLAKAGMIFEKEKPISFYVDDELIDAGYRADFIINQSIILEIKSVQALQPIHDAQLLTYMKLDVYKLGLLLNFNERLMKDGIRRKIL